MDRNVCCPTKPDIPKGIWDLIKKIPALRYMLPPVSNKTELYDKYSNRDLEPNNYAYVVDENTFYVWSECEEHYEHYIWKPITALINTENLIDNLPNILKINEDLDFDKQGQLKFSDKIYNSSIFNGLGRIYLRKNIIGSINVLTQEMIKEPNTIYIIQYDYSLNNKLIELPIGCHIILSGGSISNGDIKLNNNPIKGNGCFYNINFSGNIDEIIEPKIFGIVYDDESVDNSKVLNNLLTITNRIDLGVGDIYIKNTIYIPNSVKSFIADKVTLKSDVSEGNPTVIIGSKETASYSSLFKISVQRNNTSQWEDENTVGVRIYNCNNSIIDLLNVSDFYTGVELIGCGTGFVHNNINLYKIHNNKIGLLLFDEDNPSTSRRGWINENRFYGGNFQQLSTLHRDKKRYGIVLISKGSYKNNNNNTFYSQSIELSKGNNKDDEFAIPIYIENATLNRFFNLRNENNDNYIALFGENSSNNFINVGWGGTTIKDTGETGYINGSESTITPFFNQTNNTLFVLEDVNKDCVQATNNSVCVRNTISRDTTFCRNSILEKGYIKMTTMASFGVIIKVSSSSVFYVQSKPYNNNSEYLGRLRFICLDENREIISELKTNDLVASKGYSVYKTSILDVPCFQAGSNGASLGIHIKVNSENIKYIYVEISNGGDDTRISNFTIKGNNSTFLDIPTSLDLKTVELNREILYIENIPTVGYHTKGTIAHILKDVSTSYICTETGTPGTWMLYTSQNEDYIWLRNKERAEIEIPIQNNLKRSGILMIYDTDYNIGPSLFSVCSYNIKKIIANKGIDTEEENNLYNHLYIEDDGKLYIENKKATGTSNIYFRFL